MKWLLVILLFQLDESGQPGPATPAQQVFNDEKSCMDAGASTKGMIPKEILSIATCIPQNAFEVRTPEQQATPPAPAQPEGSK